MVAAGVDAVAIETFAHYYRLLEHGETGMIPESTIEPARHGGAAPTSRSSDDDAAEAIAHDRGDQAQRRARHLDGHGPRQVAAVRAPRAVLPRHHRPAGAAPAQGVRRPAAADLHEQLPHLRRHHGRAGPLRRPRRSRGCRWSSCRTRSPSCWPRTSRRSRWPKDPDLEWCPPGHGDLYTALRGTGLLDRLIEAGYQRRLRLQLRQPRRRAGRPGRRLVRRRPVRRSRSRRCGVRPPTARAATSPAARATAGSCCARPRRRCPQDQEALGRPRPAPVLLDQQPVVRPRAR